jgi:hypothetical protein
MVNEEPRGNARQKMQNCAHIYREWAIGNLVTLPPERSLRRITPRGVAKRFSKTPSANSPLPGSPVRLNATAPICPSFREGPFVVSDSKGVPPGLRPLSRRPSEHWPRSQPSDIRRSATHREWHSPAARVHDAAKRLSPTRRWKISVAKRAAYHVALEDSYIRAHWGFIDTVCK